MGGEPYLSDGVDFGDVILAVAKAGISFVILLVAVMLMVWFERKVVGRLQTGSARPWPAPSASSRHWPTA